MGTLTLATPEEDWELYKEEFNSKYVSDQEIPEQDLSPNLHKKKKHEKNRRSLVGKVKDFFQSDSEDDSEKSEKEKGFKRFTLRSSKRSSKSKTPEIKLSLSTPKSGSPKSERLSLQIQEQSNGSLQSQNHSNRSLKANETTQKVPKTSVASKEDSLDNGHDTGISTVGLDDISVDDEDAMNEFGSYNKNKKWSASSSSSLSEYGKVFDLDLLKKKPVLEKNDMKSDATGVTLDLDLPSVELKGPEISNGGTTKGFKLFNNAPDHKDGVTLNGEAPKASLDTDISGGEMEAELPSIKDLPSVKGPNQIEVSTPSITADLKTPSLEVETKKK